MANLVANAMGCTCGANREVVTKGKGHMVVRHEDECPLRDAGSTWFAYLRRS